jgi:transporter family-2 protein
VGGFCGALLPRAAAARRAAIGATVHIGITVTASDIASIPLDHFGLLGFHQHSVSIGRLIGAALMIAGVSLITKY